MFFECATKESNSILCVTNQQIIINNVLTRFLQLMKYFRLMLLLCYLTHCSIDYLFVYIWLARWWLEGKLNIMAGYITFLHFIMNIKFLRD